MAFHNQHKNKKYAKFEYKQICGHENRFKQFQSITPRTQIEDRQRRKKIFKKTLVSILDCGFK